MKLRSGYFIVAESRRRADERLAQFLTKDQKAIKEAQERGEEVVQITLTLTITAPASAFLRADLETAIENTSFGARAGIEAELMPKLMEQHPRIGQLTERFQRNLERLFSMYQWNDKEQQSLPTETYNAEEAWRLLEENEDIELQLRKEVWAMKPYRTILDRLQFATVTT